MKKFDALLWLQTQPYSVLNAIFPEYDFYALEGDALQNALEDVETQWMDFPKSKIIQLYDLYTRDNL